ncbi:MAG: hypothetical protein CM15mP120_11010 [Pseudomonadota bacterium]|nr:MAG: hypothetical protein CM15mP120_11010 [Pseudomonadota bacterium]
MTIGAGIGMANFTFDDADGFWRWVTFATPVVWILFGKATAS